VQRRDRPKTLHPSASGLASHRVRQVSTEDSSDILHASGARPALINRDALSANDNDTLIVDSRKAA
jgi:hypothetical protein